MAGLGPQRQHERAEPGYPQGLVPVDLGIHSPLHRRPIRQVVVTEPVFVNTD